MNYLRLGLLAGMLIVLSCSKDSVEGPMGPAGPQGVQGPIGPQGEKGEQGEAGTDGEALGVPGPQGEPGPQGPQGSTGSQGPTGATGPQGPAGEDGRNGTDGEDGQDSNISARIVGVNPIIFSQSTYYETTVSIASNEVVLAYIQGYRDSGQSNPGDWYAIPTPQFVGYHFGAYAITTHWDNDSFRFDLFEPGGDVKYVSTGSPSVDIYALKLIIIQYDPGIPAKISKGDYVRSQLERNGININDHAQVSRYFSLATD